MDNVIVTSKAHMVMNIVLKEITFWPIKAISDATFL
jgi:hypothetical protein